jgi:hypothetical protein
MGNQALIGCIADTEQNLAPIIADEGPNAENCRGKLREWSVRAEWQADSEGGANAYIALS